MAKAKKDTSANDPAATPDAGAKGKKAPAKKAGAAVEASAPAAAAAAAGGKPVAKKGAPAAKAGGKPSGLPAAKPLIDTNLAAANAAAMIANRNLGGQATGAGGQQKESSGFRQFKENLAKPATPNLDGILGTGPAQQKKSQSFGPGNQVGRNQTFGADVNRSGVPRRTGG